MQPQNSPDGFKPRYTHFAPQAIVWVQNPFDHDVVYQVADELNRPFQYKLPAKKVSELPGGSVATLGVKRIVDELIQNGVDEQGRSEAFNLWEPTTRAKYEKQVVLRIKEAPSKAEQTSAAGEIDMSVKREAEVSPQENEELDEPVVPEATSEFPGLDSAPNPAVEAGVGYAADAALAGLPTISAAAPNNSTSGE